MNKERAINQLNNIKETLQEDYIFADRCIEALDIAIESLETRYQMNDKGEITPIDNEWTDVRDRFPSDDEIAKDTEFLVKAENAEGNLINTVMTCTKEDKENREWTFGRYERENDQPKFTIYEVIAWQKIKPYERKE